MSVLCISSAKSRGDFIICLCTTLELFFLCYIQTFIALFEVMQINAG
ncbi:hypothetical protein HL033_00785 [Neoehrlichia mikurensis]|nr:hypothetical protein [Neoehrlichia mikurensis]QXK92562.1 hypothetical protein HUN61_00785 [Neoehrlichia mikurensis]QXK93798.1 hypothetical protein HL033_00785 [Neoehrlichia mikurensis]